jgi:hypothetical protein
MSNTSSGSSKSVVGVAGIKASLSTLVREYKGLRTPYRGRVKTRANFLRLATVMNVKRRCLKIEVVRYDAVYEKEAERGLQNWDIAERTKD